MVNILGLLIIIFGFFAPFLTRVSSLSTIFFWVGFLFLLRPDKLSPLTESGLEGARIALLAHILGRVFFILYGLLLVEPSQPVTYAEYLAIRVLGWVVNPASSLYDFVFPIPLIDLPGGSVGGYVSYTRATVTGFFDIVAYVSVGAMVGEAGCRKFGKRGKRA